MPRPSKDRRLMIEELELDTDDKIGAIIGELRLRDTKHLTVEDKRAILRLLALRKSTSQILDHVNKIREDRGVELVKAEALQLPFYRKRYGEAIERCYEVYALDVHRLYPFSDKFRRIGQLSDLAERYRTWLDGSPAGKISAEFRSNTSMMLKLLEALHKEMGVTRYTVKTVITKDDNDQDQEPAKDINPADIERFITQRYAGQLGIEDAEQLQDVRGTKDEMDEATRL